MGSARIGSLPLFRSRVVRWWVRGVPRRAGGRNKIGPRSGGEKGHSARRLDGGWLIARFSDFEVREGEPAVWRNRSARRARTIKRNENGSTRHPPHPDPHPRHAHLTCVARLGVPLLLNHAGFAAMLKSFPRSTAACLFLAPAPWFLCGIWHLSPADFGEYRVYLLSVLPRSRYWRSSVCPIFSQCAGSPRW